MCFLIWNWFVFFILIILLHVFVVCFSTKCRNKQWKKSKNSTDVIVFVCPEWTEKWLERRCRQTDILSVSPIITETRSQSCSRQLTVGSIAKTAGGLLTCLQTYTQAHTHTRVPDSNTEKHFMNRMSGERCGQDILWPFSWSCRATLIGVHALVDGFHSAVWDWIPDSTCVSQ